MVWIHVNGEGPQVFGITRGELFHQTIDLALYRWVTFDVTRDCDNTYEGGVFKYGSVHYHKCFDNSEEQFAQDHKIVQRGSIYK